MIDSHAKGDAGIQDGEPPDYRCDCDVGVGNGLLLILWRNEWAPWCEVRIDHVLLLCSRHTGGVLRETGVEQRVQSN